MACDVSPVAMFLTNVWIVYLEELSLSYGSSVLLDLFLETQFMRPTRVYGEIGIKWQNKTLPLENTCSVVQKDLGHALWLSLYILPSFANNQTSLKAETCWWVSLSFVIEGWFFFKSEW